MTRKTHIDLNGAMALTAFSALLAFNQVVIKVTNGGFNPVFAAALRSPLALLAILLWMYLRRIPLDVRRDMVLPGILLGLLFGFEFICLYVALDVSDVSRVSIIFYSMPVWLALAAHFLLPEERLNGVRVLGLLLAMGGVALALANRQGANASLLGDVAAFGAAIFWAAIALALRLTKASQARPESQLAWQLAVSIVVLFAAAPFFGPLVRDIEPIHIAGLGFQAFVIASAGFLFWFYLLTIYPASSVASFSFLAPVLAVIMGWLLLGEQIGWTVWGALVLVAIGIILVNRR